MHHADFRPSARLERLPYYGEVLPRSVVAREVGSSRSQERRGRVSNPTVHIGLNQLRVVVNALLSVYGPPSEIVVELVEVEQSPADLGGRKTAVESLLPEGIRVEPLERFPNDPVDGHQPRPDEGLHQPIPAADETPAPPAGTAGVAPLGRQGSLRLRISTGLVVRGENPDAGVPHATGTASGVEIQDAPADGIGSEIQTQAVAEGPGLASGRAGPGGRIDREARFHKSTLK